MMMNFVTSFILILAATHAHADLCHNLFEAAKEPATKSSSPASKISAPVGQGPQENRFFKVVPSGRDAREIEILKRFVHHIETPGGVLDKLGIPRTSQIIEFMEGRFLNALAGNGRWPVGHFQEGAKIMQGMSNVRSFIYEMVLPGPEVQHGFYRDDTPLEQQISIVLHVIGHNAFAKTTGFSQYRTTQLNLEAKKMDELIRRLYVEHDKHEVEQWYFLLHSMAQDQDYTTGLQWGPDHYRAQSPEIADPDYHTKAMRGQSTMVRHPMAPTASILQAFVANIPGHFPQWKKDMAVGFEKMVRYQTGLVQTQIMNEGFASFMQPFLIEYTDWDGFEHQIGLSKVMHQGKNFQDPYWLGFEAWNRIWMRFRNAPENKGKDRWVLGKDFIQYAVSLIAKHNDAEFLRIALDDEWVTKNGFSILRKLEDQSKWDENLPPPPEGRFRQPWQYEVVSRDTKRVIDATIRKSFYPKFLYSPRPKLYDFNYQDFGHTGLVLDDEYGLNLPLIKISAAQKLFLLSTVHHRPVSLVCRLKMKATRPEPRNRNWYYEQQPQRVDEKGIPVRVVAFPNGKIEVFNVENTTNAVGRVTTKTLDRNQELEAELQEYVRDYIQDLFIEDDQAFEDYARKMGLFLNPTAIQNMIKQSPRDKAGEDLQLHVPAMGRAIEEYKNKARIRMRHALARALKTGKGMIRRKGMVGIKALPHIPRFEFESSSLNALMKGTSYNFSTSQPVLQNGKSASNKFGNVSLFANGSPIHADDTGGSVIIDDRRFRTGDKVWGEGDDGQGQGDGDGDEGDDGNPQDGQQPGNGVDESDSSWIYISEEIYAKLLAEHVKLPNLNPKKGDTRQTSSKPGGSKNNPEGRLLTYQTAVEALKKGIGLAEDDEDKDDPSTMIDSGMPKMERHDFRTEFVKTKPKPDVNAVVVIVLDGSGSTAAYLKMLRNLTFDLRMLLKANYPKVRFEFVMFSMDAKRFKEEDEDKFWKSFPGGGTSYTAGWNLAHDVLQKEYPRDEWDRFLFTAGDYQDFDRAGTEKLFVDLLEQIEFHGNILVTYPGAKDPLWDKIDGLSQADNRVGTVDLSGRTDHNIEDFKKLLKNEGNQ